MENKKVFIEKAKNNLTSIGLEEVAIVSDLKRIEAAGGSIDLEVCRASRSSARNQVACGGLWC